MTRLAAGSWFLLLAACSSPDSELPPEPARRPSLPSVPTLPAAPERGELGRVEAAVEGDATATRALARECDAGITRGCVALGAAWEQGAGVRASADEARRLYRAACRRAGEGCIDAVRLHPDQAGPYFERGCEAGLAEACRRWATAMPAKADEARAKGCTLGWLEACSERVDECAGPLSRCVERAESLRAARPAEARRLASVACRDEVVAGCALFAALMRASDALAAQVAYQWACDAGDLEACHALLTTFELDATELARAGQQVAMLERAAATPFEAATLLGEDRVDPPE
ncbi:MAG: hypothetical protein KF901_24210 [Myxococcales bacterium]|nr:hypothetical protein [Myxococcales bacterium]